MSHRGPGLDNLLRRVLPLILGFVRRTASYSPRPEFLITIYSSTQSLLFSTEQMKSTGLSARLWFVPYPVPSSYRHQRFLFSPSLQRRAVLTSIATAKSTADVAFIFTDSQSSSNLGRSAATDYQDAAVARASPFISVILSCDPNENLKRVAGGDRGTGSNTKLTDLDILREIRETEDIFHFGDENELDLDITSLSPVEAAVRILQHVVRVIEKILHDGKGETLN